MLASRAIWRKIMTFCLRKHTAVVSMLLALCGCQPAPDNSTAANKAPAADASAAQPAKPTAEEARAFIKDVEAKADALNTENSRLAWVQATYITPDTEALLAKAGERAAAQQL